MKNPFKTRYKHAPLKLPSENLPLKDNLDLKQLSGLVKYKDDDETILWAEINNPPFISSFIIAGGILLGLCIFMQNIIGVFIGLYLVLVGTVASIRLGEKKIQILTNKRLISYKNGKTMFYKELPKIFEYERVDNQLVCYEKIGDFVSEHNKFSITHVKNWDLIPALDKALEENGATANIQKNLEKLAEENNLLIKKVNAYGIPTRMEGTFQDRNVEFVIEDFFPISKITVSVECSNKPGNYLRLVSINSMNNIFSSFKKDLEIEDKRIDDEFLIESNDATLPSRVISAPVKRVLLDSLNFGKLEVKYGKKDRISFMKDQGSKYNDQEDVLDFQLIDKQPTQDSRTIEQSELNQLILTFNPNKSTQFNVDSINRILKYCYSCSVLLAKEINSIDPQK